MVRDYTTTHLLGGKFFMVSDVTYKISFVCALVLHLALIFFLFIKFTHTDISTGLIASRDIINAVAINERDFDNEISKKVVMQEKLPMVKKLEKPQEQEKPTEKTSVKPLAAGQIQDLLKKNLLKEQAQELAELKKAQEGRKKRAIEQKEEVLQKILQKQVESGVKQKSLVNAEAQAAHGNRLSGEVDKYKTLIKQAIYQQWIYPEGAGNGDFCRLFISMAPGGAVLEVKLLTSSGNAVLDRSAQAAVFKASPLPVPEDLKLFNEMRVINLTFKPEGIVGN